MAKLDFNLPNLSFIGKAAIAVLLIMLVVRMTPDKWGIKRWFTPV